MNEILNIIHKTIYQFFDVCGDDEEVPMSDKDKLLLEVNKAICNNLKALEQTDPKKCGDCISRQELLNAIFQKEYGHDYDENTDIINLKYVDIIKGMSSVEPEKKTGYCKNCKYFEYDSVAKVDGIPLIVAHEICNRWGKGCKTSEDGYCFLYESQESEV